MTFWAYCKFTSWFLSTFDSCRSIGSISIIYVFATQLPHCCRTMGKLLHGWTEKLNQFQNLPPHAMQRITNTLPPPHHQNTNSGLVYCLRFSIWNTHKKKEAKENCVSSRAKPKAYGQNASNKFIYIVFLWILPWEFNNKTRNLFKESPSGCKVHSAKLKMNI